MVDQELEDGLRSLAAPIRDPSGTDAALNVSVHASRTSLRELRERFLPLVLETTAAIEDDLRAARKSA
jgi:IclR family pca regulon transcriptional regulator